jgi:hypothetical protein
MAPRWFATAKLITPWSIPILCTGSRCRVAQSGSSLLGRPVMLTVDVATHAMNLRLLYSYIRPFNENHLKLLLHQI